MEHKITVRKPFRFLPPLLLAVGIDALDIVPNTIDVVLTILGTTLGGVGASIGVATNTAFDIIQGLLALVFFDDWRMWSGGLIADGVLPAPLDLFPSYTATALAIKLGVWK